MQSKKIQSSSVQNRTPSGHQLTRHSPGACVTAPAPQKSLHLLTLPNEMLSHAGKMIDNCSNLFHFMTTSKHIFNLLTPVLCSKAGIETPGHRQIRWIWGKAEADTVAIRTREAGFVSSSLSVASVKTVQFLDLHVDEATICLAHSFHYLINKLSHTTKISLTIHTFAPAHWSKPHLPTLISCVSSRWKHSVTIQLSPSRLSIKAEFPANTFLKMVNDILLPLNILELVRLSNN
ncbi:hypothetical protein JAAARDRAFT_49856 [Jaapia argillacea MUCL 33604]|uniref:Uncharacterized protein n=1 Tax=Jaapia argillacea MUCL 33604 TaxID=933084 RepID=A0A067PQ30_9AGAM|nr:hypothetical protein JAAARDRAFT_49856 [Jaapia argillacea MUCL 33604]